MTVPSQTQENQAQATDAKANDKEINFRKQQQMYERQLDEERAARAVLEKKLQERESSKKPHDDEEDDASDEPYVDKKRLKREIKSFGSQIREETQKEVQNAVQQALAQERKNSFLKQNNDFDQIMQPEVLQKFIEKHPDVAENILAMPESFERQKLVYANIKALGLHKKEEAKPSIQQTIDANRRSPYYQPSGVGTAPYAAGGDFSPAGQKSAYAKLQELKSKLRV